MIIFDSNIWIAFLFKYDSSHSRAKKIFENLDNQIISIPEYIVIEVSSILAIKAGKEIADEFLDIAFENKKMKILLSDNIFFREVVEYFKNIPQKDLSFIDVSLLYLSKSYDIKTFDQKLARAIKNIK